MASVGEMGMNRHRQVLASIINELTAMDPGCSILLGGSLARDEERDDSDIDLVAFLSREPEVLTDLVGEGNRSHMHVFAERDGIKIDIGWKLLDSLPEEIPNSTEFVFYPAVRWKVVRDPSGRLGRHLQAIRRWAEGRQWLTELWDQQLEEMRRHKKDASYPIKYKEKEFYAHLRELIDQRKKEKPQ